MEGLNILPSTIGQEEGERMFLWILLSVCCIAAAQQRSSSSSGEYGGGGGKRFTHTGNQLDGPITALRVRVSRNYVVGLQIRYGTTWSDYKGGSSGELEEVFLHPGEAVIQVTGTYSNYIRRLVFVTNKGRYFPFGKDYGKTLNATPLFPNTVLRYISGSSGSVIDAISFHWDYANSNCVHCAK
ncbi:zymogen granule membrane protein 16-like isoform X1 [Bufo bufo]|uniref:zymogen granule membrane protein 16-like isoform X1 n=2 Tax=Bufo bufo TaxID=8384 RepID=UPI001ABE6BE4|nr:zymogen granule membrane protein 16-like isoform X1 [Bufo bufo]